MKNFIAPIPIFAKILFCIGLKITTTQNNLDYLDNKIVSLKITTLFKTIFHKKNYNKVSQIELMWSGFTNIFTARNSITHNVKTKQKFFIDLNPSFLR